jgi:hypothetical protein
MLGAHRSRVALQAPPRFRVSCEITAHDAHVKVDAWAAAMTTKDAPRKAPLGAILLPYAQRSTANRHDSVNTYGHPHARSSGLRAAVAGVAAVVVALAPAGVASADNSNTDTNNNDVTNLGDANDMFARPNENTSWPPADVSWPPNNTTNSGGENGGETPIVMPTAPT